jgi:hypothetical protein
VCRRDVESELLDEAGEARRLTLRQVENEPSQCRGVDDRMLERAFQAAADEPRVERVVAVLDEHRALGKAEESASRVLELRRADEHRAVDVVPFARVGIDGRAAVDQRVEEGQRALEGEALRADLEHEERRVARGLHVKRDELGVVEFRAVTHLGRVDCDLFPRDGLDRSPRLQKEAP